MEANETVAVLFGNFGEAKLFARGVITFLMKPWNYFGHNTFFFIIIKIQVEVTWRQTRQ